MLTTANEIPSVYSSLPTSGHHAETLAVAAHRAQNRRSRASSALVYGRNSNASKSLRCVFTGVESPTWCSTWPRTKRVDQWIESHLTALFGEWLKCE